jgi:hypothetical protein
VQVDDRFRREVLCNIFLEYGTPMELTEVKKLHLIKPTVKP